MARSRELFPGWRRRSQATMLPSVRRLGRSGRPLAVVLAATAGLATAVLVGVAFAKTLTLQVARHATVVDAAGGITHEPIVVNARARAIYELSGDSKRHPECTAAKGCFAVWPPVRVASLRKLSKSRAIRGRLGVWRRDGFLQVTLSGHPLYTFAEDGKPRVAHGEGITAFGGTWHVLRPRRTAQSGSTTTTGAASSTTTSTATSTTSPTTTTPPPCFYPPCP